MRRLAIAIWFFISCVFPIFANAYSPLYAGEKSNIKLRWKTNIIPVSFSNSLLKSNPNIRPDSDVTGAVKRSLETWEKAANVVFETTWTDKQSVSMLGNAGDGVSLITIAQTSENLLMFSKDSEQVSARTRVFFNRKGNISEADIVLNPYQQFSTDGSVGTYDLESTLTHEIGHLLGLEHSPVLGATMHENNGKNGVFNLPDFDSRTLSQTDISAIRAIYGANDEVDCCASISGKLTSANGKPAANFSVWLEESENGKVIAQSPTNSEGFYKLEGLSAGNYQIYSQEPLIKNKQTIAAENIGNIEIAAKENIQINKKLSASLKVFELQYLGFNSQLSELAVPLNGGKSYLVYLGGNKQNLKNAVIGFNSPYLKINTNSIISHDFGENVSVISFEVNVDSRIPFGEYSIFVESDKKIKEFLVGGLVVDQFANPWNNYTLTEN